MKTPRIHNYLSPEVKEYMTEIFSSSEAAIISLLKPETYVDSVIAMSECLYDAVILSAHEDYNPATLHPSGGDMMELKKVLNENPKTYDAAVFRMQARLNGIKDVGKAFEEANGAQRSGMIAGGVVTILAPGYFGKVVKTFQNLDKFGTVFNPPKFPVLKIDDLAPNMPNVPSLSRSKIRKLHQPQSLYYVILENGKLVLANEKLPQAVTKQIGYTWLAHPNLSKLAPVVAAGTTKVKRGNIFRIDNQAEHFHPSGKGLKDLTETAFVRHGYREAWNKFRYVSDSKHTMGMNGKVIYTPYGLKPSPLGLSAGVWLHFSNRTESDYQFIQEANAEEFFQHLPTQKRIVLEDSANSAANEFNAKFTEQISHYVKKTNPIFDGEALLNAQNGEEDILLNSLHTAFNIFKFIAPQKAKFVADLANYSGKMLSSGATMISGLSNGLNFMATSSFALASGNFLVGFSGILSMLEGKDDSAMEGLWNMLQGISNQIANMHEDMLEGFRHISRVSAEIHHRVIEVLQVLHQMDVAQSHRHEEIVNLITHFTHFIYVDRVYLQEILSGLQRIETHLLTDNLRAGDWQLTLAEINTTCHNYPNELSLEAFKTGLSQLVMAMNKVQHHSLLDAKANKESAQLSLLLNSLNSHEYRNYYELFRNRNIHLIINYLKTAIREFPQQLYLSYRKV